MGAECWQIMHLRCGSRWVIAQDISLISSCHISLSISDGYFVDQGKSVIAFYFSAHWCPPCRQFTPVLARSNHHLCPQSQSLTAPQILAFISFICKISIWRAYSESRVGEGKQVEVVFVSSDRSEAAQQEYMREAHGGYWYAIGYVCVIIKMLRQIY